MTEFKGHAMDCYNPGCDDYWTCPSCYADLGNVGTGETMCPKCECIIECSVEQQPVCHSKVVSWPIEKEQQS